VLIGLNLSFALEFQLIGGVVIIQILPALVLGPYTRWYHRWSLVVGWIVGMGLYVTPSKTAAHFCGSLRQRLSCSRPRASTRR
jgi:solute:Na+ symporter, SSS family